MTALEDARTLARWRRAVLAAFALGGITLATWGPRLPNLRGDLGVSEGLLGIALGGVTVGSLVGLGLSSAVLAWVGPRRGILGALWVMAVGIATVGVGGGVAHSFAVTSGGFVTIGLGIGCLDVLINVEASAVETTAGRTLMPLMHAAWSAGAILGAGFGAAGAAAGVTVQVQFVAEALLIAGLAPILARRIPQRVPVPVLEGEERSTWERVRGWARGWGDWRLLVIGMVMLGVELGEGSANNWLTLAVRDGHHQANAVAALFFVVFAVGETMARVLGSPLVDRIGRTSTVRVTTALGVLGMVLFIATDQSWLVLVGTFLWAVGVSMGFPLGMSSAAESGPDPAARVSVVASIGNVANLAGPPVVGLLSQAVGLLDALWLVAALLAVAFALSGVLGGATRSRPARGSTP